MDQNPFDLSNETFLKKTKNPEREKELVTTFQQQLPGYQQAYRELQKMYYVPIQKMITQSLPKSKDVSKAQLLSVASNKFPEILKRYDPDKDRDLFSWVNNNMRAEFKNTVREDLSGVYVPRGEHDALNRYRQAKYDAELTYGPKPTDDQIFSFFPDGYDRNDFEKGKKYFRQDLVSDSVVAEDDEGRGLTLADMYTGAQIYDIQNEQFYDAKLEQLKQLMKIKMLPDEYNILSDYFFENKNMAQTSLAHNISSTKLRNIIKKWEDILEKERLNGGFV